VTALSQEKVVNSRSVFPSRDGKSYADIRDAWELALERAGIEDFRFHDLRHTAASNLAMNGVSPLVIAELLGHKQLTMVKRYAHLSNNYVAEAVEQMNKQLIDNSIA
jgi:integrase